MAGFGATHGLDDKRDGRIETEPPATCLLDPDRAGALTQTPLQEQKSRFQILGEGRQPQVRVQPQLAVRDPGPAYGHELPDELPQDRAGHALAQVVVDQEHAVVRVVVTRGRRPRPGRHRRGRAGVDASLSPTGGMSAPSQSAISESAFSSP